MASDEFAEPIEFGSRETTVNVLRLRKVRLLYFIIQRLCSGSSIGNDTEYFTKMGKQADYALLTAFKEPANGALDLRRTHGMDR